MAKIDEIEREAWDAFKESRQDAETMEVTGTTQGGKGKPEKVKKVTHRQYGDARFLTIILDCVKQRCQILGLEAPKKPDHTTGGQPFYKAYLFDPDNPSNPEAEQPA